MVLTCSRTRSIMRQWHRLSSKYVSWYCRTRWISSVATKSFVFSRSLTDVCCATESDGHKRLAWCENRQDSRKSHRVQSVSFRFPNCSGVSDCDVEIPLTENNNNYIVVSLAVFVQDAHTFTHTHTHTRTHTQLTTYETESLKLLLRSQ